MFRDEEYGSLLMGTTRVVGDEKRDPSTAAQQKRLGLRSG